MSLTKTFQTLYKQSSVGKIQQWTIEVTDNAIKTIWGQHGGKLQETIDVIKEGKNIGKSNETTPHEQALAEAESQWEKKLKKGYVKIIKDAKAGKLDKIIEGGILPMLAPSKSYPADKDCQKYLTLSCYVQPKLDGMRCIAIIENGECTLWSRERRPIKSVPHIAEALCEKYAISKKDKVILDGELYNSEFKDQFEDLISILRKDAPDSEGQYKLAQYHIYDVLQSTVYYDNAVNMDTPYSDRLYLLETCLLKADTEYLKRVQTEIAHSYEEIDAWLDEWVELGYEGLMMRNANAPYDSGKRSRNLWKAKFFLDGEYKIIGIEEGRGKLTGKVGKFICVTPDGVEFGAPLKMSHKRKQELFENPKQWQGKFATVNYKRITQDGSLYLPRVKAIRPAMDLAGQPEDESEDN